MSRLRPAMEYSEDVVEYIRRIFADNGVYLYPRGLQIDNPILEKAEQIIDKATKLPLKDDSFVDRQAVILLTLNLYTKNLTDAN